MVKIFKQIRRLAKKLDLFSSIQLLRFQGDAETKTLTGGIISLAIFIYLAITFFNMIVDTFHKVVITSISDTTQADTPSSLYMSTENNGEKFMLGVEVFQFNLNSGPRYFDVFLRNSFMKLAVVTNESIYYKLEPCTKDHWQYLPNIDQLYDSIGMSNWLCMPLNVRAVLNGTYFSDLQSTLDIVIEKCNNATDASRPCATQAEIDTYMQANSPLYFTPYFYNPLINAQSQNYLKTYLETKYYTTFGPGFGAEMYIYTSEYKITTDQSILPFESDEQKNGPVVSFISQNSYNMGSSTDVYSLISFFRAPQSIVIERSFQKVVDVLSYVGGLLGAFLLVFLLINFYNECSYEMNFAASLFKSEKDCPTNAGKFNLIYYLLTALYGILDMVNIKCSRWKSIEFFHETRQEMVRQLDVKYLFRKLNILQNAVMLLLSKPQLKGLMLQHKMTVAQAKKTRYIYTIKNRLKKYIKQKMSHQKEPELLIQGSELNIKYFGSEQNLNEQNKVISQNGFKNNEDSRVDSHLVKVLPQQTQPIPKHVMSDSDASSSGSDVEEDEAEYERVFDDLSKLKQQSSRNSYVSQKILNNLDPFIKKMYQKRNQNRDNSFQSVKEVQMEEVIEKNFDEGKLTNNKMLKLNKNERFAEDIE